MLADPVSQSTYLIIDALDECIADLDSASWLRHQGVYRSSFPCKMAHLQSQLAKYQGAA